MYHLLTTDSAQHSYGTKSLAGNAALVLADRQLQKIMDAVERAGIKDRTTIFVVSDHGFKTYHHVIHPNALLKAKGLVRSADDNDGWVVPEGGTAHVYVTREEKRKEVLDAFRWADPRRLAGDRARGVREVGLSEGRSERTHGRPRPRRGERLRLRRRRSKAP